MNRERERDLVDSSADELAAENNVTEQDGEIAAWLWVLRLLIQHEPCYCHQVRPVCLRRVIHFPPSFLFSLLSLSLSLNTLVLGSRSNSEHIYIDIYFKVEAKKEVRKKGIWVNGGRGDEMRWDEMMGLSHIHICCQRKFRRTRGGPGVKGVSEWSSLLCG